jgi:putative hydrolase of the HAD superfamily
VLRAVVFDLDDTLTDHRGLEREVWATCRDTIVARHPVVDSELLTARHRGNLERFYVELLSGALDEPAFQRARLAHALEPWEIVPSESLLSAYVAHKQRFLTETWPAPGAAEAVAAARARGLRVGVLTNGTQDGQSAKLARLGLEVDALVTSEAAGAPKPERVAFAAAEAVLGVGPEEVAMVGDNVVNDIAGALDAGWAAAVHVRAEAPAVLPAGALAATDALAAVVALGASCSRDPD